MPRVLIVSSMWLPHMAADMHRARLLASALPPLGWDVELLVPDPTFQLSEHLDPHATLLARGTVVHAVAQQWSGLFRLAGSRSIGWRAYLPLRDAGDRLLANGRFDLVYISCAQHVWFHLAAHWKRRHDVPVVLDIHDPWYVPRLGNLEHLNAWKARVANQLASTMERVAISAASGLISVSARYLETLNERYAHVNAEALREDRQAVVPFAVDASDLAAARRLPIEEVPAITDPATAVVVYTGAGSSIMERAFRQFCGALSAWRDANADRGRRVRIELYGTEPQAPAGKEVLSRVATETGVADLVTEYPARVPYLTALRRAQDADGLIVLGVDDPAYMPSKLFLYGLTGRPILAVIHPQSEMLRYFASHPDLGHVMRFAGEGIDDSMAIGRFLDDVSHRRVIDRHASLEDQLAPAMAARHVELFDRIRSSHQRPR